MRQNGQIYMIVIRMRRCPPGGVFQLSLALMLFTVTTKSATQLSSRTISACAANDANLMERIGAVTAKEVAATGIDWTFGPCLAVARDERWGRTYESFAEDPSIHDNIVDAYVRGLQGIDANMQGEKIVAFAKHYIGDGGTTGGVNAGNMVCTEAFLRAIHLPPYERAIDAGVGTFMTSFSSWNGTNMRFLHLACQDPAQKRAWFRWIRRFRLGGHRKQFN